MKKSKLFLGLLLILVLSTGLISMYGCSALTPPAASAPPITEIPVTQTALETLAAQPTVAALVTPPVSTPVTEVITPIPTAAPVITTTTTAALVITTTTTAAPAVLPIIETTPVVEPVVEAPVIETTTTPAPTAAVTLTVNENQLADIRSKAEQPSPGIYYIDAATAKKMVDSMPTVILDARYKVDWDKLHIAGSLSLPVSSVWIQTTHPEQYIDPATVVPDKDAVIITYCAPGCPAGLELAGELAVRGYHNLFVLIGGYLYWQEAGYGMVIQ
jgi:rhodanese-related sulfurtransferase